MLVREQEPRSTAQAGHGRDHAHLTLASGEGIDRHAEQGSVGDLARAAARGETLAWPTLVRKFSGLIGGIAWSYGLSDADVADVTQVVWMRLVTHVNRLNDADRIAGWLATTTRNECIRAVRQRNRMWPTSDSDALDSSCDPVEPVATTGTDNRAAILRSVVQTLPEHQRRLAEMLLRSPRPSYKEISDALDIPMGSIGPTRQRCLAVLRRKCISAGIGPIPA